MDMGEGHNEVVGFMIGPSVENFFLYQIQEK